MQKIRILISVLSCSILLMYCGCTEDPEIISEPQPGQLKVFVLVIDGPRYTETWGLSGRTFIPNRVALSQQGSLCDSIYNNGHCYTNAGHAAITTGFYQSIDNMGQEIPQNPSFFQLWLEKSKQPHTKAWIITSKDKLQILKNCSDPDYNDKFLPSANCGNAGNGSGYREDVITLQKVFDVMKGHHPLLMLINFKEPDASAHAADSTAYLNGIIQSDIYVKQLWDKIESDPFYKGQTILFVTNDHGRHTAGHLDGYVSHGDTCEGCKHIELLAIGPHIKKNHVSVLPYDQTDIAETVARLMKIKMPQSTGKPILDIFTDNKLPD